MPAEPNNTMKAFQEAYGFMPRPNSNVAHLNALINEELSQEDAAAVISEYRFSESWVRMYDLNNRYMNQENIVGYIHAIVIDVILHFDPDANRNANPARILKGALLERYNTLKQFVDNNRATSTANPMINNQQIDPSTPQHPSHYRGNGQPLPVARRLEFQ